MKYIANIVTSSKIDVSCYFFVTSDFSLIDESIPTLIVGWEKVRSLFPKQNILEHKISDTIFWTFSKRERRYQYEQDMSWFINKISEDIINNLNYTFFNYLLSSQSRRDNFIKYINETPCSLYYNSRFLYIYVIPKSITIGISLNDLSYLGINISNFIQSLNKSNNNIVCDNLNCIDSETFSLIKENTKIIAYLNYLKNCDIYIKS